MTATDATPESLDLRELLRANRDQLQLVLDEYRAVNPRIFGSVARGEAGPDSDIDLLVDLLPDARHSDLIRVGGLRAGLRRVLDQDVDVLAPQLLRARVSATALKDAVPL
ncbi:nucleotidyltransferase family protein [Gryllotalpicola reticulitermitis]|uniref:Nucleotidyltransferase family protein n=1 Tax=Gryllotalpicola reticulitermitis TaxID=1184153 RepID=A0ABV8Q878_9MICO